MVAVEWNSPLLASIYFKGAGFAPRVSVLRSPSMQTLPAPHTHVARSHVSFTRSASQIEPPWSWEVIPHLPGQILNLHVQWCAPIQYYKQTTALLPYLLLVAYIDCAAFSCCKRPCKSIGVFMAKIDLATVALLCCKKLAICLQTMATNWLSI